MTVQTTTRPSAMFRPMSLSILKAVALALAANLALWLIGLALGGDFTMNQNGAEQTVAPGGVVIFTVVPLVAGLGLAALLALAWRPVLTVARVVGPLLGLATIAGTVQATFDGVSTTALATMHVVAALAAYAGLGWLRSDRDV